jgi:hypothetical protein
MVNIFQDPTKVAPKQDSQIVRVSMEENQIAGRKDHMPSNEKSVNAISHVPNSGSKI